MYFDTYDAAQSAAIKQSKGQLGDCKLYIKAEVVMQRINDTGTVKYKIGFTYDNADDAYIYNGEVFKSEAQWLAGDRKMNRIPDTI